MGLNDIITFYDDTPFPDPKKDGIDHINIYSAGKTKLGRMLSNFYHSEVTDEKYGTFQSLEGFWYWYFTGQQHEVLRTLHGYKAKKVGKRFFKDRIDINGTTDEMIEAQQHMMIQKVLQNESIKSELIKSELEFTHYYNYSGTQVFIDDIKWFTDTYEDIRKILKEGLV